MKRSLHQFQIRLLAVIVAILTTVGSYGCAVGNVSLVRHSLPDELGASGPAVTWLGPEIAKDLSSLGRWRRSVGPPVAVHGTSGTAIADRLLVVNWNLHVGGGDLRRLFADLQRVSPGIPIVFLLQEAYRGGPEVPSVLSGDASFASSIRGLRRDGKREEIESIATALGVHAYYVPSMRNGGPLTSDEDRGNAILSTIPLTELTALELPFERQRRVAVAATVAGIGADGRPWRLRVVSAHLDNMLGASRLWIAGSEWGRARQARGLVSALRGQSPLVLGADLNTWFGFSDRAYREAAREFPQTQVTDHRATFRGLLRLDHLFFRLQDGWSAHFRRADDSYDSDHFPLIGEVVFRSH